MSSDPTPGSDASEVVGGDSQDVSPTINDEYRGSETILLVDDDAVLRKLFTLTLERYGYRVLVAHDGEDALRVAGEHMAPIHLLLSDVVMPRRNGCSLSTELRRWYPGMGVLLFSGWPEGEEEARALRGEATFFIRKPFGLAHLMASVRAAIDWRPRRTG
jgi:two-component system, cell cycle sensor histidine kinase and response regulator CckA